MSINHSLAVFLSGTFPLLTLPAYILTHALSWHNGFYEMIKDVLVAGHFPGPSMIGGHADNVTANSIASKGPSLQSGFTGLHILDDGLRPLVAAISPVYDGSMPELSLFAMLYGFSWASVCIIVHLEAMRMGNRTIAILQMPSLLVLLFEVVGFGVLGPLWMGAHVICSPTRGSPAKDNVSAELHDLQALPISIIVGYLIPIMLPLLPDKLPIPVLSTVQSRIAGALAFPTYICFIQTFLAIAFKRTNGQDNGPRESPVIDTIRNRSSLRRTHLLAFLCNAVPHVIFLTLNLLPRAIPAIFNPSMVSALGKTPFYESFPSSADVKASSMHEGLYWYLQWQYLFGMLAFLLWGLVCYASARARFEAHLPLHESWLGVSVRVLLVTLVFGAGGSAVMLLWERDEALMDAYLCKVSLEGEKADS